MFQKKPKDESPNSQQNKSEEKVEPQLVISPLTKLQPEIHINEVNEIDVPMIDNLQIEPDENKDDLNLGDFFTTGNVKEEVKEESGDLELVKQELQRKQQ